MGITRFASRLSTALIFSAAMTFTLLTGAVAPALAKVTITKETETRLHFIGDSITFGWGTYMGPGLRGHVYALLKADGHNFRVVGTKDNKPSAFGVTDDGNIGWPDEIPALVWPYTQHSGTNGARIYGGDVVIETNLRLGGGQLQAAGAYAEIGGQLTHDIAFVMAGTNDILKKGASGAAAWRKYMDTHYTVLLDYIRGINPEAYVFVVETPPMREVSWLVEQGNEPQLTTIAETLAFNSQLDAFVADYNQAKGVDVRYLPLTGWIPDTHQSLDGIHPGVEGYRFIGERYVDAILALTEGDLDYGLPDGAGGPGGGSGGALGAGGGSGGLPGAGGGAAGTGGAFATGGTSSSDPDSGDSTSRSGGCNMSGVSRTAGGGWLVLLLMLVGLSRRASRRQLYAGSFTQAALRRQLYAGGVRS